MPFIINNTNLTHHHMKKILAVAAFAFAFSVNGYAQEAAALENGAVN